MTMELNDDSKQWENLPVDEILALHFTHPKEMDGASRLHQHDNVHKQITAFEKLLQHSINRFSTEKLYQMLSLVVQEFPIIPRAHHMATKTMDELINEISSLDQLQQILLELKDQKRKGIEKEEQSHLIKYFETLFEDITYLKSLKKYFDERVYICLYDYFYDPADDTLDPREVLKRERKNRVAFEDDLDSGNSSYPGSDDDKTARTPTDEQNVENELEFYFDKLDDNEKLSLAVRKMFQLNERWDELFADGEIDPKRFDPDSRHELLLYSNYDQFELILRLIPDIFVKAYKSIEVAKLWWTQANKIYEVLPQQQTKRRKEKDTNGKIEALEKKVSNLRDEISTNEELLMMQNDDLRHLQEREARYVSLSEQCEKLEDRKNMIGERYNKLLQQRDQLKRKLEKQDPHTESYKEFIAASKDCEQNFFDAQVELKMLSFQFQLVQSDFLVELGIRPELVRFQIDVQMKIEDTKNTIWSKNVEKTENAKRLALLRTNCERMRKIMRKYFNTGDDSLPVSDQSKNTKQSDKDKVRPPLAMNPSVSQNHENHDPNWSYYDKEKTDTKPHHSAEKNSEKQDGPKSKPSPTKHTSNQDNPSKIPASTKLKPSNQDNPSKIPASTKLKPSNQDNPSKIPAPTKLKPSNQDNPSKIPAPTKLKPKNKIQNTDSVKKSDKPQNKAKPKGLRPDTKTDKPDQANPGPQYARPDYAKAYIS